MPNSPDFSIADLESIVLGQKATGFRKPPAKKQAAEFRELPRVIKDGFTLGCDPEGFIFNTKTNKPVPASRFIPGTKWEPHKVDKGAIQVDGMAAEFNTDPAKTAEEWEENISAVIKQLEGYLPPHHELRWCPSVVFDRDDFNSAPDECKELGCSPDFDAWSGAVNPPPYRENPCLAVAGGHIHFGWTKDEDLSDCQHLINCQDLGKQSDYFLGAWGAFVDKDTVRPTLYGKMGAIRFKPYGVEYRVLSNFWVANEQLRRQAWDRACMAIDCMSGMYMPDRVHHKVTDKLRQSILTHEVTGETLEQLAFPIRTLDARMSRW